MTRTSLRILSALVMALSLIFSAGAAEPESATPSNVVIAFNSAMRQGDAVGLTQHLADGGVQFTIKSPHEGFVPEKLTTPIVPYWQMVAPVVAGSTSMYERNVEVLDERAMGNIATVWVQIDTRRQLKGKDDIASATANHVYFLILTREGWKIAGIADNRAIDDLTG